MKKRVRIPEWTRRLKEPGDHSFGHFKAYFPKSKDPILLILRGHLLVEQQMTKLIEIFLEEKQALDDVRLSFSQKAALARALAGGRRDTPPWDSIRELNRVRNLLAHELSAEDANERMDSWLKVCFGPDYSAPRSSVRRASHVEKAFALTCGILAGYRCGYEDARKPNQPLQPPALAVTPAADAPVAPDAGAVQL